MKSIHWNPPPTGGLKIPHTPIGTCKMQKIKILNFVSIVVKMCSKELRKKHLGHFDWNCLGSRYAIRPYTHSKAIVAENRRLSDTNGVQRCKSTLF